MKKKKLGWLLLVLCLVIDLLPCEVSKAAFHTPWFSYSVASTREYPPGTEPPSDKSFIGFWVARPEDYLNHFAGQSYWRDPQGVLLLQRMMLLYEDGTGEFSVNVKHKDYAKQPNFWGNIGYRIDSGKFSMFYETKYKGVAYLCPIFGVELCPECEKTGGHVYHLLPTGFNLEYKGTDGRKHQMLFAYWGPPGEKKHPPEAYHSSSLLGHPPKHLSADISPSFSVSLAGENKDRLIKLINQKRISLKRIPLAVSSELCEAALARAKESDLEITASAWDKNITADQFFSHMTDDWAVFAEETKSIGIAYYTIGSDSYWYIFTSSTISANQTIHVPQIHHGNEDRLIELINQKRVNLKYAPLTMSSELCEAALARAKEFALEITAGAWDINITADQFFSHMTDDWAVFAEETKSIGVAYYTKGSDSYWYIFTSSAISANQMIKTPEIQLSGSKVQLDVPFLSQRMPKELTGMKQDTTKYNCNQTITVMMEAYYKDMEPRLERVRDAIRFTGHRDNDPKDQNGNQLNVFGKPLSLEGSKNILTGLMGFEHVVLKGKQSLDDIKGILLLGNPVIVRVKVIYKHNNTPKRSNLGHFILLIGFDDDTGEFILHDPGSGKGNAVRYKYDDFYNDYWYEGRKLLYINGK